MLGIIARSSRRRRKNTIPVQDKIYRRRDIIVDAYLVKFLAAMAIIVCIAITIRSVR
jgi:hypothetical protein